MKKIGNYFFELVAIFIGITASFMVENYRVEKEREEEIIFSLESVKNSIENDIEALERNIEMLDQARIKIIKWRDRDYMISLQPDELLSHYVALGAAIPFSCDRAGYSIYIESSGKEFISDLELRRHLGQYYQVETSLVESNSAIDWDITKDFIDYMISKNKDFPPYSFVSNQIGTNPYFKEHLEAINEDTSINLLNSRLLIFQTNTRLFSSLLEEAKSMEEMLSIELRKLN